MAGDWIKMRIELQSHPKVVRILSATSADKFRVIGGLHAVWGVFDLHSQDGVLNGYTPETMDHIIGWEGFSDAMIRVGWMFYDGEETLTLPEFTEHNGQSAKRRAEDQKRKRNGRKSPQSVRKVSASEPDNKRKKSGLEKRREEKKNISTDVDIYTPFPKLASLKDIDFSAWPDLPSEKTMADWLKCRAKKKLANTQSAMDLTCREINSIRSLGPDAETCIWYAAARGWGGFKGAWLDKEMSENGQDDLNKTLRSKIDGRISKLTDRGWAE